MRKLRSVVPAIGLLLAPCLSFSVLVFASESGDAARHHAHPPASSKPDAQHEMHGPMQGPMEGMRGAMVMRADSFTEQILNHSTSGTSAEPNSTPTPMLMTPRGAWTLMFHGVGFVNDIQQSGPRGRAKLFGVGWIMPMAQRQLGPGTLTLRAMLSPEPATVTGRRFPELLQQGETAFGNPITDGQHPHDLFMELAAIYDLKAGENTLVSFYGAAMGDPALGPTAYPHRASASEDPLATLGHHLQDSSHIVSDVLTVGLAYKLARIEFSGFHGREPDENRWNIDAGRLDSWSTRLTVNPAQNWSAQYSIGFLHSPEGQNPLENTLRETASLMYNRPLSHGNWASTLIWGRNRTQASGEVFNSYLAESTLGFRDRNHVWGRIENVDRTNELLLGGKPEPPGFQEHFLARVQAYTAGYDRDFWVVPHVATALGAQVTLYSTPASLVSLYGSHPRGIVFFLRLKPR
ncbi:MAG TPA: hypothetical protein VGW33_15700 [Terriglobia bacterium]|nr:hypothetical protein [Terriglobia bacterium]